MLRQKSAVSTLVPGRVRGVWCSALLSVLQSTVGYSGGVGGSQVASSSGSAISDANFSANELNRKLLARRIGLGKHEQIASNFVVPPELAQYQAPPAAYAIAPQFPVAVPPSGGYGLMQGGVPPNMTEAEYMDFRRDRLSAILKEKARLRKKRKHKIAKLRARRKQREAIEQAKRDEKMAKAEAKAAHEQAEYAHRMAWWLQQKQALDQYAQQWMNNVQQPGVQPGMGIQPGLQGMSAQQYLSDEGSDMPQNQLSEGAALQQQANVMQPGGFGGVATQQNVPMDGGGFGVGEAGVAEDGGMDGADGMQLM